jgi:DNA-binding LacI/PurR family transcriptional regulator
VEDLTTSSGSNSSSPECAWVPWIWAHSSSTAALPEEFVVRSIFSLEGGQAAASRLLDRGVTGIVCASDPLALGAIRAVRRRGLSVPEDVSVVGFDDSAFMSCTEPPLSTVRQPIEAMGRAAVELLCAQIQGTQAHSGELLFEPELVVRSSTAQAPVG